MAVCVGNVHTNDGFFDATLSLCVNNVVRGAWGAALINLELYDLHVRPLIARAAAKQRAAGGTARDAVRDVQAYVDGKAAREGHVKPHWDVLLRWARSQEEEPDTPDTLRLRSNCEIRARTASGPGRTSRRARVRRVAPCPGEECSEPDRSKAGLPAIMLVVLLASWGKQAAVCWSPPGASRNSLTRVVST